MNIFRLNLTVVLLCITVVMMLFVGNLSAESVLGNLSNNPNSPNNDIQLSNLERVSVGPNGEESNGQSYTPNQSADGRYVVYASYADNWYAEDNSGTSCFSENQAVNKRCLDIFVRDRDLNTTTKLTYGTNGNTANLRSAEPVISSDGQSIFFFSWADNLVQGDTNNPDYHEERGIDMFRHKDGNIDRVSVDDGGNQIDGKSVGTATGNGQYTLFGSTGRVMNNVPIRDDAENLYLRDVNTGEIDFVSPTHDGGTPNDIFASGLAADDSGRYIVFSTFATNILPGDNNGHNDVFLFDRESREMKLVSRTIDGGYPNGPSGKSLVSPDGTFVAFHSEASNIVEGDTNGVIDIFTYNIADGTIERVSVGPNGEQSNGGSKEPTLCKEARLIGFFSDASNLVDGDNNNERDGFIKDTKTGQLTVVTRSESGAWGNDKAHKVVMAPNCDSALFASDATNLIPNDNNDVRDIFRWDIELEKPADFATSTLQLRLNSGMTNTLNALLNIQNRGDEAATVTPIINLPSNVDIDLDSLSTAMSLFNGNQLRIVPVTLNGNQSATYSFRMTVPNLTADPTAIALTGTLILDDDNSENQPLSAAYLFNGQTLFLPMATRGN